MKAQKMEGSTSTDQARREYVRGVVRQFSDNIAPSIQHNILAQEVVLGMSPYEAHLAAGAFSFRVKPDMRKWSKDADPYAVMWRQSMAPDNSQIWMIFETDTQFPGFGMVRFRVQFEFGKVIKIDRMLDGLRE
jgi:hypothetical protein